jgi:hypothetical protein
MGCCSSSEAGAERKAASDGGNKAGARKELSGKGGKMSEVSVTTNLSLNCKEGHPFDKYDVLDTLGTGGFAVVKRVRDKHTSENFAMKIISVTIEGGDNGVRMRGGQHVESFLAFRTDLPYKFTGISLRKSFTIHDTCDPRKGPATPLPFPHPTDKRPPLPHRT